MLGVCPPKPLAVLALIAENLEAEGFSGAPFSESKLGVVVIRAYRAYRGVGGRSLASPDDGILGTGDGEWVNFGTSSSLSDFRRMYFMDCERRRSGWVENGLDESAQVPLDMLEPRPCRLLAPTTLKPVK
jgi:hypothetical protein